jgi:hypothetical protein
VDEWREKATAIKAVYYRAQRAKSQKRQRREVLGIEESAADKRYFRALKRLKETLADMPGGKAGICPTPMLRGVLCMAADSSERLVFLNKLGEEFAARYWRGERPSLQEYIDRHPELADDIREFFPTMAEMEQFKDDAE